jgi:hypothetical protein
VRAALRDGLFRGFDGGEMEVNRAADAVRELNAPCSGEVIEDGEVWGAGIATAAEQQK